MTLAPSDSSNSTDSANLAITPGWYPSPLIHPSVMMPAGVARELAYDEDLDYAQDYDLWFRIAARFRLFNLPDYLLLYRVHSQSVTTSRESMQVRRSKEIFQRYAGRAPDDRDYLPSDRSLTPFQHARRFWPAARRARLSMAAIIQHEVRYARAAIFGARS